LDGKIVKLPSFHAEIGEELVAGSLEQELYDVCVLTSIIADPPRSAEALVVTGNYMSKLSVEVFTPPESHFNFWSKHV
jgi:hypothetical protein